MQKKIFLDIFNPGPFFPASNWRQNFVQKEMRKAKRERDIYRCRHREEGWSRVHKKEFNRKIGADIPRDRENLRVRKKEIDRIWERES